MDTDYEIIDHTADAGVIAYGTDIGQAFASAATAMFSLMTELGDIDEELHRDIEINASDEESLLVEWLNELIYLFDTEDTIFRRFDITDIDSTHLRARSYGAKLNPKKHELKTGVKAATYHRLQISRDNGCRVRVIFDV